MEPQFWHERWSKNEIGFHQPDFNPHMIAFAERLQARPGDNVLVPLCGKSLDMLWLAEAGYRVTGVEISEQAAGDFFRQNELEFVVEERPAGRVYRGESITIHCADFLAVDLGSEPPIAAVYDRASLIALPPPMRPGYVRRVAELTPAGVRSLLISLEYPQEQMRGPPFSVPRDEVLQLFAADFRIEDLHREDCLEREPRFKRKGLTRLVERIYLLQRKPGT